MNKKLLRFKIRKHTCIIYLYDKEGNVRARTIINKRDYAKVKDYVWRLDKDGYVITHGIGKLHRIILDAPAGLEVDHKDRNKLNNKRSNLRLCNKSQNGFNRNLISTNITGIKGVVFNGYSWVAHIAHMKKSYDLGSYKTPIEAAKAYNEAAIKFGGDFAWINDMEEVEKLCKINKIKNCSKIKLKNIITGEVKYYTSKVKAGRALGYSRKKINDGDILFYKGNKYKISVR